MRSEVALLVRGLAVELDAVRIEVERGVAELLDLQCVLLLRARGDRRGRPATGVLQGKTEGQDEAEDQRIELRLT